MSYVPQNSDVFIAAFTGALAGMAISCRVPTSTNPAAYNTVSAQAFAWAQSFDTEWGAGPTESSQIDQIAETCESTWNSRGVGSGPQWILPATYTPQVKALIALINNSAALLSSNGIQPGAGSNTALTQPTWYIDSVNGNDAWDGAYPTHGTGKKGPLKTHRELQARWGVGYPTLTSSVVVDGGNVVTVNILNDLLPDDAISIFVTLGPNTSLQYLGKTKQTATGTITASTLMNRAANQACEIKGSINLDLHVGERLRCTNDATPNLMAWIAKDLGGHTVRTSSAVGLELSQGPYQGVPDPGAFTPSMGFTVGKSFVLESLPAVSITAIDIYSANFPATVGFTNLTFNNNLPINSGFMQTRYTACNFETFANLNFAQCNGCRFDSFIGVQGNDANIAFGMMTENALYASFHVGTIDGDFLVQGSLAFFMFDGTLYCPTLAVFDFAAPFGTPALMSIGGETSTANLTIDTGGLGVCAIWGKDNTVPLFALSASTTATLGDLTQIPTVVTAGVDFLLGVAADGRPWDEATGAYLSARPCTWAKFAAALGAGGFNGNAHNLAQNAHFCVQRP